MNADAGGREAEKERDGVEVDLFKYKKETVIIAVFLAVQSGMLHGVRYSCGYHPQRWTAFGSQDDAS